MTTLYQIRTYDPDGVLTAVITDFLNLTYVKEVNSPGRCEFELNASHQAIAYFELNAQVEIWRRTDDIAWYCDFYGFWRGEDRYADSNGNSRYVAICIGQMDLIDRPIVGYPANTAERNAFTSDPAETIAKTLVTYNATSSGGTADGRVRDVDLSTVTVEADGAAGGTIDFNCAWRYLLPALQEVASIGGGNFDLVKTDATEWEFRWYDGQLGADRSATVTFALQYGNMANPRLRRDYSRERTVAIVAGQGEEDDRDVEIRTSAAYDADVHEAEMFVDARQMTTAEGLQAAGDIALYEGRTLAELTFDVLQVPSTQYGLHYFLGDLVTAYYAGYTATKQIWRVSVGIGVSGLESIQVETRDV